MHVHLVGICGTAMASLAKLLVDLGHRVSGSDEGVYPPMSDELARLGIDVSSPYAAPNLDPAPDLVVIGNAIARGNPEVEACLDRGLRYTSQAEALEDLVLPGRTPVVVTGTHGKTTTTALIAWTLAVAGREPGWFVGGMPLDLPYTAALGKSPEFVLEGDEYDTAYFDKRPKFHHYRPRILVVNNLEYDHADIYPDLESIVREFRRLVHTVPAAGRVVVGADSPAALEATARSFAPVIRFALKAEAEYGAAEVRPVGAGMRFLARRGGVTLGELELAIPGRFQVANALACLAVCLELGVPLERIARGLQSFRGVRRRLEQRGSADGVEIYDDFAHHPTAIHDTIDALRGRGLRGRLWAVLEPRSWSMRRNVHQAALPAALAGADVVVLAPVFQLDRVPPGQALDVACVLDQVRALGREAHAVADAAAVASLVAERARPGDAILVMSNGGFDRVHDRMLEALVRRPGARS